jgi:alpha-N-arabinofuranosidase
MNSYQNPIIPGFNPDPSICRAGEDYYIAVSSFEFFPGVPLYHSKNLADWEMTGHCLTRPEQLPLNGCRASGGIYAPTLRYHEGIFYMVTTNVSGGGNFIVHTQDINGPWSDPAFIDQGGIDPSLLFDGGKVYFCSNGNAGTDGIFVCEVEPRTGEKFTPSRLISSGCGGRCPEAPHIYHIGLWYYLLMAEGGTEYGHMVTIQRSRNIYGPYVQCPHNPS